MRGGEQQTAERATFADLRDAEGLFKGIWPKPRHVPQASKEQLNDEYLLYERRARR